MKAKSFAVGVRMEHPQELIDSNQYGRARGSVLPAADYKVTRKLENGKGVYSFCMCPGGYVVNASSEEANAGCQWYELSQPGRHGMPTVPWLSRLARRISVRMPFWQVWNFSGNWSGRLFRLEKEKYRCSCFGDFLKNRKSQTLGEVEPQNKGQWQFGDVRGIFPEYLGGKPCGGDFFL